MKSMGMFYQQQVAALQLLSHTVQAWQIVAAVAFLYQIESPEFSIQFGTKDLLAASSVYVGNQESHYIHLAPEFVHSCLSSIAFLNLYCFGVLYLQVFESLANALQVPSRGWIENDSPLGCEA